MAVQLTMNYVDGWPIVTPLGRKETQFLQKSLSPTEKVLGQIVGNFGQAIVATDARVLVIKTGAMAGVTFGGKVYEFTYHEVSGLGVETKLTHAHVELLATRFPHKSHSDSEALQAPNVISIPKNDVLMKGVNDLATKIRERGSLSANSADASSGAKEEIMVAISQLSQLHSAGALTDAEFEDKKKELLGRI